MQNEITELRNQVRTLKRIVYGFGCLLVAGVVVGATSLQRAPNVIQAKKFEVVNDEGKIVSVSSSDSEGHGMFFLMDKGQKATVHLGSNQDSDGDPAGGSVSVLNEKQKDVVSLSVWKGDGQLYISNKDGNFAVDLGVSKGAGNLSIMNKDEETVVDLGVYNDGGLLDVTNGSYQITGKEGLVVADLGIWEESGYLNLRKDKNSIIVLRINPEDESGLMYTNDKKGDITSTIP